MTPSYCNQEALHPLATTKPASPNPWLFTPGLSTAPGRPCGALLHQAVSKCTPTHLAVAAGFHLSLTLPALFPLPGD